MTDLQAQLWRALQEAQYEIERQRNNALILHEQVTDLRRALHAIQELAIDIHEARAIARDALVE